ncbi:MATE family efflux transporter [Alkalihalobacterium bogoriense]|uniref:MATE family efflux transporter n=1 Tax=Alkalihalobacterium bogoriense TaxID=246272 RepID=UPI00047BD9EE|nr:MATE family efflux transporter [Alkalihalobacterium bogoriense]
MNFNRELKILVIPFVLHMLISNSFSFIDTLMIAGLGEVAVAAMAAAGQFTFVLGMILSASYGITAFITQFYGKGDMENVHKALGLMLVTAFVVSTMAAMFIYFFKQSLLSIFFTNDQAIWYGIEYVSIIVFVFVLNSVKDAYGHTLGAIGKVKVNVIIGLIGMAINTGLNYLLIYGHWGFPRLEVKGAAIATLVSTLITIIVLLGFIYGGKYYINAPFRTMFAFDWRFVKKVYRTTLPIVLHEGIWSVGNMMYAVAFGYLGVAALAVYQLARTFNNYFMMGIFGFSYAAKVMIGKKLSLEDPTEAIENAKKFTRLSIYSAITVSLIIIIANPYIVSLFSNLSEEVQATFRNVLYIQAVVLPVYFLNNIWIVGLFRTGGDNVYSMKLVMFTTWFIALPLVYFGAVVMKWPIELVYIFFALEEVSKACIGYFRFRSNKWANNLVSEI